jgi:rubredoxin
MTTIEQELLDKAMEIAKSNKDSVVIEPYRIPLIYEAVVREYEYDNTKIPIKIAKYFRCRNCGEVYNLIYTGDDRNGVPPAMDWEDHYWQFRDLQLCDTCYEKEDEKSREEWK